LTIGGRALSDARPSVYAAKAGDEIQTVTGRRRHSQHIEADSLVCELLVSAAIAALARRLSGRKIPCRLEFVGERTNRRMCTRQGKCFGLDSFVTSFAGVDAVTIGDSGDYAAELCVIDGPGAAPVSGSRASGSGRGRASYV
jgi:hypothetical protein